LKWFKHFTDNHRGKSVQFLLDELGYFGPFFKDTILEMCAEKLDKKDDRELSVDDCAFVFHRRVVESATRAKRSTVVRALDAGSSANFWSYVFEDEYIKIKCPILLDFLEYDQKKSRQRRADVTPGKRLDKNRIEENREEKNIISSEPNTSVAEVEKKPKPEELKYIQLKITQGVDAMLTQDLIDSWSDTYPKEYLELEMKKARSWLIDNPDKRPKTRWGRFFNGWFDRGWDRYRKGIQSSPAKITSDQVMSILRGENVQG